MKNTTKFGKIKISQIENLNFISNLSTMISAGIPILTAIHSLLEEARGNIKIILEEIHADLLRGNNISACLAKFTEAFDKVTVNMLRAAEESGSLDTVLLDLREQIKKDIAFSRKIKSALIYPVLVLIIFIAVLLLILVVVIPKISTVFKQLKIDIPLTTRVLISASDLLLHNTLYVITGIVIGISAMVLLFVKQKKRIINLTHLLPVLSRLTKEIDLFHFTRSMHLLLASGITITTALELTEEIVINTEVAKAITETKHAVYTGKTLSYTFKQHRKIFPGTMIELTQAGEKTGTLDKSMHNISEYFDYKISDTLVFLTTLFEPLVLVLVAILVGSMMIAIIGPVYNLIGQIGNH